jgi:hypothetical protein
MDYINEPTDMEIEVLRILNGEDVPDWTWGAAMSACCESLKSVGLAKGCYEISDKGKIFLDKLNNT